MQNTLVRLSTTAYFSFAALHIKPFLKRGLCERKALAFKGSKCFSFSVDPLFGREKGGFVLKFCFV